MKMLLTVVLLSFSVLASAAELGERSPQQQIDELRTELQRLESNARYERQLDEIRASEARQAQRLQQELDQARFEQRLESERRTRELQQRIDDRRRFP